MKILSGNASEICRSLRIIDVWNGQLRSVDLSSLVDNPHCDVCGRRKFAWLTGERGSRSAILCGRDAVQLYPTAPAEIDLAAMAEQLAPLGEVSHNGFLLRFSQPSLQLTLFPDGRAIVSGTQDISEARTFYARYVGH